MSPSTMGDDGAARRWIVPTLILICLALYLPGLSGLPPMDRDEPRFAQASKQMLETGDYVSIRFQDEARNKKPVGIYWLQAGAVALGDTLGVPDARRTIWLYRLPSFLGAIGAVLGTYWTACAVGSRRVAFMAALLFAATVLLTVESHLAKTDAVLCCTVVLVMGSLLRILQAQRRGVAPRRTHLLVFWTAVGVGLLIKGPITPMIPAFALAAICVRDRSWRALKPLRAGLGLSWVVVLVLPWLVLILLRTHGAFLADSVGGDMLGKATGARESHGAPPGTYLAVFWATAWPLAPFAALAARHVWRRRTEAAILPLLAWLVPSWLLFELVPTKLPHYVLPLYPAVAILTALALDGVGPIARPRAVLVAIVGLLALLPAGLAVTLLIGRGFLWSHLASTTVVLGSLTVLVAGLCAVLAARWATRGDLPWAVAAAVAAAVAVNLFTLGDLLTPRVSNLLALSSEVAAAGRAAVAPDCQPGAFASAGDHEPSLVFLTGTSLRLVDAAGAAAFMQGGDCRAAFVDARSEPAFRAALGNMPDVERAGQVGGTAINGGKRLDIAIYVRHRDRP